MTFLTVVQVQYKHSVCVCVCVCVCGCGCGCMRVRVCVCTDGELQVARHRHSASGIESGSDSGHSHLQNIAVARSASVTTTNQVSTYEGCQTVIHAGTSVYIEKLIASSTDHVFRHVTGVFSGSISAPSTGAGSTAVRSDSYSPVSSCQSSEDDWAHTRGPFYGMAFVCVRACVHGCMGGCVCRCACVRAGGRAGVRVCWSTD